MLTEEQTVALMARIHSQARGVDQVNAQEAEELRHAIAATKLEAARKQAEEDAAQQTRQEEEKVAAQLAKPIPSRPRRPVRHSSQPKT